MRNRRRQTGFTLIELMVTLAVLVILVSLASPIMNMLEQRKVVGAAEGVFEEIQFIRSEAIMQGRELHLRVQADSGGDDWCIGISNNAGCDCSVEDSNATDACLLDVAVDDDGSGATQQVLRRFTHDDFADVSMEINGNGDTELDLAFDGVRGIPSPRPDPFEQFRFESSPNNFELGVEINAIGRPSICASGRATGRYQTACEVNP
ncbi:GspH/FimT family pseudopilin [Thioalkalivibrio halophilus]|uniref:Type II secretion system protein H n=1 Tax=Thioalkalivibrio halophilus TaxID=252474 RepID=A0A1V2ZYG9_9GAMM|nr:GspH/FimT family pseudopilin [Thioalkalivibrio halophilus]OOC10164.1 hypothetical protein B1A74_07050 [Thioalkalivibrio halophilus]